MMTPNAARALADALTKNRFAKGTLRSEPYRLGFYNLIYCRAAGTALPELYPAGSAYFDAYHAGADAARPEWADYLQNERIAA